MTILVLHRSSGETTLQAGSAEEYARAHGFVAQTVLVDGDQCTKLLFHGAWVATAQAVTL